MIFNGVDLSDYFIAYSVSRSVLPEVNLSTQDVPGMDGTRVLGSRLSPRSFTVKFLFRKSLDRYDVAHDLAEILYTEKPKELIIEPGKYYMAMVSGSVDLDSLWKAGGGEFEFYCPDPIAYEIDERTVEFTGSGKMAVHGTYKTYPVIEVSPAVGSSNYQITNANTGKFVKIDRAFSSASKVVIDMQAQRVTIDGKKADMYVDLDSDFFSVDPGDVELSSTGGNVKVRWHDRWL